MGIFLWLPIVCVAAIAYVLFWAAGYQLTPPMVFGLGLSMGLGAGGMLLAGRLSGRGRRVGAAINAFYQLSVAGGVGMMLAYAAATTGRPLYDEAFLAFDRTLHYEWTAYARFFAEHRGIARIVLSAYFTMIAQPLLLILVLSATDRVAELEKFILASFASLLLTIGLFACFPATTAWAHLGISDLEVAAYRYLPVTGESWVQDLHLIRAGHRSLPSGFGSPIIAFPSLHCASGLVYLWAGWRVRWLRPILLVLNAMMLAATPIVGGHYVADLIGGAAVALCAILLAERAYLPLAARAEALRARAARGPRLVWSVARPAPVALSEAPASRAA
ncbi:MAG TPA: phosphatase PAP2 family protein [Allosphingosinicella sp.]|jgi:hypothetical protein